MGTVTCFEILYSKEMCQSDINPSISWYSLLIKYKGGGWLWSVQEKAQIERIYVKETIYNITCCTHFWFSQPYSFVQKKWRILLMDFGPTSFFLQKPPYFCGLFLYWLYRLLQLKSKLMKEPTSDFSKQACGTRRKHPKSHKITKGNK